MELYITYISDTAKLEDGLDMVLNIDRVLEGLQNEMKAPQNHYNPSGTDQRKANRSL
ncbi:MAG: hypothetical protein ACQEQO_07745 [Thermodesulfobacteriota bacterium]